MDFASFVNRFGVSLAIADNSPQSNLSLISNIPILHWLQSQPTFANLLNESHTFMDGIESKRNTNDALCDFKSKVVILGMQKTGTTALYTMLQKLGIK